MRKRLRGRRWQAIRKAVLERDRYRCQDCGALRYPLEISHIVAVRDGGSDELTNLRVLCRSCHLRIDADPEARAWRDLLAERYGRNR